MHTLESLTDQILSSISDYVEFDAKEIFEQGDFIAIFGGAVRDSIAKKEIHDIDILCLPESAHHLREFVISKGYELADLYDKDQWETTHKTTKAMAPDVTAKVFLLKNRRPS